MKKLAFIVLAGIISATAFCGEPGESWIKTDDGQTQCEKVIVHKDFLTMTCTGGKEEKIPLSQVDSYSKNGKVYIKQSIYLEAYQPGAIEEEVFMKLVASKNGMDLLRYIGSKGTREFVYKGNQLIQELNATNKKEFHELFGV